MRLVNEEKRKRKLNCMKQDMKYRGPHNPTKLIKH